MTDASPVKLFKPKKLVIKPSLCLICGQSIGPYGRKPKEKGIAAFIDALEQRKYCNNNYITEYKDVIDFEKRCWKEQFLDKINWHVNCYASFVSKHNIRDTKNSETHKMEDIENPSTNTRSNKPSIDLKTNCMFCCCKKRKKESRLVLLQLDSVVKNIEKQCNIKNDEDLRLRIGGDFSKLPAFEAKYHPNCYKSFMRQQKEEVNEKSVHDICFENFLIEIDDILLSGRAVELQTLLERFKTYLQEEQYENIESYTVQKLRQRIEKHYGDAICITTESNKRQSVYSSEISIADAINAAFELKKLNNDKSLMLVTERTTKKKIVSRAAEILREDIQKVEGICVHPLNPKDISKTNAHNIVPESLEQFLQSICQIKEPRDNKTLSIAQDIISLHFRGKKKMPKNVSLAVSLKNCLRSKEFITCINNLGHCISYDDLLRIETSWCEEILAAGDGYATIPSNIDANLFTQAASDNGDYGQESASQHVTNTVLYQYPLEQLLNGNFDIANINSLSSKRRRSVIVPQEPFQEYTMPRKPKLPQYYTSMKASDVICSTRSEGFANSSLLTKSWILLRLTGNKVFSCEPIVDWTSFNKLVSVKVSTPTIIGNCRSLPGSPTQFNVVFTMMKNVQKMLTSLGQTDPCITVDESIYQMSKEIQWTVPTLQNLTIRLGGFHRIKNFLGIIGKRMKSSGISEILESSDVFGPNQVEGILNSPHYNRAIRAHKMVFEAMSRVHWNAFVQWTIYENHNWRLESLNEALEDLYHDVHGWTNSSPPSDVNDRLKVVYDSIKSIHPLIERFDRIGTAMSQTFVFWSEYLSMIDLLLNAISAERDSDWNLHIETFKEMLNYDRAFDHFKYFKWGSIYIMDMMRLPIDHPDLHKRFRSGCHAVSRCPTESKFNMVSTDMALEQSMNRDSKTKGGIIGISQDFNAVEKWTLSSHMRAAVFNKFKELCGINLSSTVLSAKKIAKDESAVKKMVTKIEETLVNPFKFNENEKIYLLNIATGAVVPETTRIEILDAKKIGETNATVFIEERIITQKVSFWHPIKRLNLNKFSSIDKKMIIPRKEKSSVVFNNQQSLLARLLSVSICRFVNLKEILMHELSAVPLSIFHPGGEMRKTNKSELLHELESSVESSSQIDGKAIQSASVIDFMAILQSTSWIGTTTFKEMVSKLEKVITSSFHYSSYIAVVPDRYNVSNSIKAEERSRRNQGCSGEILINSDSQRLPCDMLHYLKNPRNKTNVVNFVFDKWKTTLPIKLTETQVVYLANIDGTTTEVRKDAVTDIDLVSDHEEADSKMLVYCKYMLQHPLRRLIVSSPDTDVLVICCYHMTCCLSSLHHFWFKTGSGQKQRFLPIHDVNTKLGGTITKMLPAFHSITGCDSVSSFSGIGKRTAFNVLKQKKEQLLDLLDFGDSPVLDVQSEYTQACILFVCSLYNKCGDRYDIDTIRYKCFTQKNKSPEKLPPTLDALVHHLKRACYQAFIWKNACQPKLSLPSPVDNGWCLDDGNFTPKYMSSQPVPKSTIELICCKCKKGCKTAACSCRRSSLVCTDVCQCHEVNNDNDDNCWNMEPSITNENSSDTDENDE